jgi:hypothetical protein
MEKDPDAGLPGQAMPAILMYHSISPYEEDPYDITVCPERFGQQMRWLRRAGREGTSVGQLLEAAGRGAAAGLVGLSFDDGYADFIDHALPGAGARCRAAGTWACCTSAARIPGATERAACAT